MYLSSQNSIGLILPLVVHLLPVFFEGLVAEVGIVVAVVEFGAAVFGDGAGERELHLVAELLDFVGAIFGVRRLSRS